MWRCNDVFKAEKQAFKVRWFVFVDIKPYPKYLSALETLDQSFLAYYPTSSGVYYYHTVLHNLYLPFSYQPYSLLCLGNVERYYVRFLQQGFKVDKLHTNLLRPFSWDVGIVGNDVHFQSLASLCNLVSNPSEAYDSDCFSPKFYSLEFLPFPFSFPHRKVCLWDSSCNREHKCYCVFCSRNGIPPRGVDDYYSPLCCGFDVYIVNPDSGSCYNFQSISLLYYTPVYPYLASDDQGIIIVDYFEDIILFKTNLYIYL